MPPTAAAARIDVRVDQALKKTIEEAAAVTGQSTTDFVLSASLERAKAVLRDAHTMTVSRQQTEAFFAMLEQTTPNGPLTQLIREVDAQRIR